MDYTIDLASFAGQVTVTIPEVPNFWYKAEVSAIEQSWSRVLYNDEVEVFSKNWAFTDRSGAERDLLLEYTFEGTTKEEGAEYMLWENINFLPGYAEGHVYLYADVVGEVFATFRILKPDDYFTSVTIFLGEHKEYLWCTKEAVTATCSDKLRIGEFDLELRSTPESDCITLTDTRMDSWASACLFANDTFARENSLYDGTYDQRTWNLTEVEMNQWTEQNEPHTGLDILTQEENQLLMSMAYDYADLHERTEGFTTQMSIGESMELAAMVATLDYFKMMTGYGEHSMEAFLELLSIYIEEPEKEQHWPMVDVTDLTGNGLQAIEFNDTKTDLGNWSF